MHIHKWLDCIEFLGIFPFYKNVQSVVFEYVRRMKKKNGKDERSQRSVNEANEKMWNLLLLLLLLLSALITLDLWNWLARDAFPFYLWVNNCCCRSCQHIVHLIYYWKWSLGHKVSHWILNRINENGK